MTIFYHEGTYYRVPKTPNEVFVYIFVGNVQRVYFYLYMLRIKFFFIFLFV